MPSNPPTVADLEAEVADECGLMLADVGQYLRALDGNGGPITPAIRIGLRKGAKVVGLTLSNGLLLQDADVAQLTTHAIERVRDEAVLFALQRALLFWARAAQKHMEAYSTVVNASGWMVEEKAAIKTRVAQLAAECSEPYREPTATVVMMNRDTLGPFGEATYPDGYGDPYGYGWGGGYRP